MGFGKKKQLFPYWLNHFSHKFPLTVGKCQQRFGCFARLTQKRTLVLFVFFQVDEGIEAADMQLVVELWFSDDEFG